MTYPVGSVNNSSILQKGSGSTAFPNWVAKTITVATLLNIVGPNKPSESDLAVVAKSFGAVIRADGKIDRFPGDREGTSPGHWLRRFRHHRIPKELANPIPGFQRIRKEAVPVEQWQGNTYGWPGNHCQVGEPCSALGVTSLGNNTLKCQVKPTFNADNCVFQQIVSSSQLDLTKGATVRFSFQALQLPQGGNLLGGVFFTTIPSDWAIDERDELDTTEIFAWLDKIRSNIPVFNANGPGSFSEQSQIHPNIQPEKPFEVGVLFYPLGNSTYNITLNYYQEETLRDSRRIGNFYIRGDQMEIRANAHRTPPGANYAWNNGGQPNDDSEASFQFADLTVEYGVPVDDHEIKPVNNVDFGVSSNSSKSQQSLAIGLGVGVALLLISAGGMYLLCARKKHQNNRPEQGQAFGQEQHIEIQRIDINQETPSANTDA